LFSVLHSNLANVDEVSVVVAVVDPLLDAVVVGEVLTKSASEFDHPEAFAGTTTPSTRSTI
jgi:hypothetical protein